MLDQLDKTAAEKLAGGEHETLESDVDADTSDTLVESEQSASTVAFDHSAHGLVNGGSSTPKTQDSKLHK